MSEGQPAPTGLDTAAGKPRERKAPDPSTWILVNERSNTGVLIPTPLKKVEVVNAYGEVTDYDPGIRRELAYYARTRDLEHDSIRTRTLQDRADRMVPGRKVATRVYVMRKGGASEAFVFPDGSIFISQSLLNREDFLDEDGAIIAHEKGHVVFETFLKANHSRGGSTAVTWLHEGLSDAFVIQCLVDADLNSTAFGPAIEKASPEGGRDSVHMTSTARSSLSVGAHSAVDTPTSNKPFTPLPLGFNTESVDKTNLEIIREMIEAKVVDRVRAALPMLHQRDLGYSYFAYPGATKQPHEVHTPVPPPEEYEVLQVYHDFFTAEMTNARYSKVEQDYFFLTAPDILSKPYSYAMVATEADFHAVLHLMTDFARDNTLGRIHDTLFAENFFTQYGTPLEHILENMAYHIYDPTLTTEPHKIPVTRDGLLQILSDVNVFPSDTHVWSTGIFLARGKGDYFRDILKKYSYVAYSQEGPDGNTVLDEPQIRAFLQDAKDRGIPASLDNPLSFHLTDSHERQLRRIFIDVYGENLRPQASIDKFFDDFSREQSDYGRRNVLTEFLPAFREQITEANVSDSERLQLVEYFHSKVDELDLTSSTDLNLFLHLKLDPSADRQTMYQNIRAFNLRSLAAITFFSQDSPEFYQYMNRLMNESGIDLGALPWQAVANIAVDLLRLDSFHSLHMLGETYQSMSIMMNSVKGAGKVVIQDYEKFLQLPFLKYIVDSQNPQTFPSINEVNAYVFGPWLGELTSDQANKIYSDSLLPIIAGRNVRQGMIDVLSQGIQDRDLRTLESFIFNQYPDGPQRTQFLRVIRTRYLKSTEVTLDEKVTFLENNFSSIDIEGMILVAEQITTLNEYLQFRQRMGDKMSLYVNGEESVVTAQMADDFSSEFTKNFETLLETTKNDPKSKRRVSTKMAKVWLNGYFGGYIPDELGEWDKFTQVQYDQKAGKVRLHEMTRQVFRTLADVMDTFHTLSPFQRFAIAWKSLVDREGALTSVENRQALGKTLVDALQIKSSFVRSFLTHGVETAPAGLLSFPAAQMIGPLLFRGMDVQSVDIDDIRKNNYHVRSVPPEALPVLMRSTTRDVTEFGGNYSHQPNSWIARESIESDSQFRTLTDALQGFLTDTENGNQVDTNKRLVDPSTEAVIGGIEASGALGVRSLQLTRQLKRLSPNVDERLSQANDSAPGMNKLQFWENFYLLAERDAQVHDFLYNQVVSIDEEKGAGSLNTTRAARIKRPDGTVVRGVIKQQNPNPEFFITQTHQAASTVFDRIEATGSPDDRRNAQMGRMFIDLSQQWCLRDINDATFVVDDDAFRQVIASYNQSHPRNNAAVYAPDRLFTHPKINAEVEAAGPTLNRLIKTPNTPRAIIRDAAQEVLDLFSYELSTPAGLDDQGQPYFLVHSDPHVGNFIVDESSGQTRIGVIDRSMYIRLSGPEAQMFRNLLQTRDYYGFVSSFIDQTLDRNKIVNAKERSGKKDKVLGGLRREYVKQRVKSLPKRGQRVDSLAMLQRLKTELFDAKLEVPLEYEIMLKSVESLSEVRDRYVPAA